MRDALWIAPLIAMSMPPAQATTREAVGWTRARMPLLAAAIRRGHVLVVSGRGALIGSADGQTVVLELLVTWPRGRGTGSALLREWLSEPCVSHSTVRLLCQPALTPFYARFGFTTYLTGELVEMRRPVEFRTPVDLRGREPEGARGNFARH